MLGLMLKLVYVQGIFNFLEDYQVSSPLSVYLLVYPETSVENRQAARRSMAVIKFAPWDIFKFKTRTWSQHLCLKSWHQN